MMAWSDYWGALNARQRAGIGIGAAFIVATLTLMFWWLRDPYESLAAGLNVERIGEIKDALERAKIAYRIEDSGAALSVPRSQLGNARLAAAGGPITAPPNVGLELFNETDFSANDFTQRINYQRALQGELARTIQTFAGVRAARVHLVLADEGLFKRNASKASAAVGVTLQPGVSLSRAQIRGMQRLVAASVPGIKSDDVVVLDESGASLSRPAQEAEGDLSSAQLDLKRQADQYLESKLAHLLQEIAPQGAISISVDTTLDNKQLRVTSEEPLAARDAHDVGHVAGVLVKERQAQRGRGSGYLPTSGESGNDSVEHEYEYKVGQRIEQALSGPGSIKRISVAVAIQGAPAELTQNAVEGLVAHAIGIDQLRGDALSVLLMPVSQSRTSVDATALPAPPVRTLDAPRGTQVDTTVQPVALVALLIASLIALAIAAVAWMHASRARVKEPSEEEVAAIAAKVRQWLDEGVQRGRA